MNMTDARPVSAADAHSVSAADAHSVSAADTRPVSAADTRPVSAADAHSVSTADTHSVRMSSIRAAASDVHSVFTTAAGDINTTVIRSARKTISIQLRTDGILIRAPFTASDERIETLLNGKRAWIERYYVKVSALVHASAPKLTADDIQKLAEQALEYIPKRAAYYADIMGVRYHKITIRNQRTKWGSCSSKGNLNFNCLLMLTPPEVIDSVVVHELCHLKEMNHSDRFYAEIAKVYPEYDCHHAWLKENGSALIARMR